MTSVSTTRRSKFWLYAGLVFVFFVCLWVGWRDFDPMIPQSEVREMIRSNIRRVIQILVQFVIPGAILVFFAKEGLAKLRSRSSQPGSDA